MHFRFFPPDKGTAALIYAKLMNVPAAYPSVLFVFLFPAWLHAQKTDSMMSVYAENYPQEKLHVHFDKSVYNAGETIWFKAYIFSGAYPSPISRNFYA